MKKNKGFTLIELLAVIVILAVLMVIAVPKILNVIENSRNSAANSSIKLIKDGIKTNVAAAELTTNPYTKTDGCYLFDFDTPNENVNNLTIENKEKAGGSIKLCNGKFSDDTLTFDGSSSSSSSSHTVAIGTTYTYDEAKEYTQTITETGIYKLEVWGAQGGSYDSTYHGGYGGYSIGEIRLTKNTKIYINVGGQGSCSSTTAAGGYNGGGSSRAGRNNFGSFCSGAGATHIALDSGELSGLSAHATDGRILIVSGGGGGAIHYYDASTYNGYGSGGSGGGYLGSKGTFDVHNWEEASYCGLSDGGSQTTYGWASSIAVDFACNDSRKGVWGQADFGKGGSYTDSPVNASGTGGGAGYYGGGMGRFAPASGGSGYIANPSLKNKKMVMYATDNSYASNDTATKTEITTNLGSHESNKANTGNGYAKITLISY